MVLAGGIVVLVLTAVILLVLTVLDGKMNVYFNCNNETRWVCVSTNTRIVLFLIAQWACLIVSAIESNTNEPMLGFGLISILPGLAFLCRFPVIRQYKFFAVDESLRLSTFFLMTTVLVALKTMTMEEHKIAVMIFELFVIELCTFVNPRVVWESTLDNARHGMFVTSLMIGHFSVIAVAAAIIETAINKRYQFEYYSASILFPVVAMTTQIFMNNECANYFSALGSDVNAGTTTESRHSITIHLDVKEKHRRGGLFSRVSFMLQQSPNWKSLAGIQSLNILQIPVIISTIFACIYVRKGQESNPRYITLLICGILSILRTGFQQAAFMNLPMKDSLSVIMESSSLEVSQMTVEERRQTVKRYCRYWVVTMIPYRIREYLSSWKGKIIICGINFFVNAVYLTAAIIIGIHTGKWWIDVSPLLFFKSIPYLAWGVSVVGTVACVHTYGSRRFDAWGSSVGRIIPKDDSLRLTMMCTGSLLGLLIIILGMTTPPNWNSWDVSLLPLVIMSMFASMTATSANIWALYPYHKKLHVPNPRILMVGYIMLHWWIICGSISAIVLSYLPIFDDNNNLQNPMPILMALGMMVTMIICNELARYLQCLVQQQNEENEVGNIDSCMGIVSWIPILLNFGISGFDETVIRNNLNTGMDVLSIFNFVFVTLAVIAVQTGMTPFGWAQYRYTLKGQDTTLNVHLQESLL